MFLDLVHRVEGIFREKKFGGGFNGKEEEKRREERGKKLIWGAPISSIYHKLSGISNGSELSMSSQAFRFYKG